MTRTEIETALDEGRLETLMTGGGWGRIRRNGKTKTWITRPGEFRIPVKAGLYSHGTITDSNMDSGNFRIRPGDPT